MATCLEIERLERPSVPFSFTGASSDVIAKELRPSRGDLARAIRRELRGAVQRLLVSPSAEIFRYERAKVFGEYALLAKTLSKIIASDTDPVVQFGLVQGALEHIERVVRERAEGVFGADVTGEILFSIGTLRRTYRICAQFIGKDLSAELRDEDQENAKEFGAAVSWCGFHLDCILAALEDSASRVPLDVLQELMTGLRCSVTAYAYARIGYDLRYKRAESQGSLSEVRWDDEDIYLALRSTEQIDITE